MSNNYDEKQKKETACPDICDSCMSGVMILVSIISGILFAALGIVLFVNSILTAPFTVALTALITGFAFLFTVVIGSAVSECRSKFKKCIRCHFGGLFFGILGTIFSAVTAAAVTLTAESVLSAVLVGPVFFFFAYMVVSMVFFTRCTSKCS